MLNVVDALGERRDPWGLPTMTGLFSEGLWHRVMLNVADALGERRDPLLPLCSKWLKTGKTLCHCFTPKVKKEFLLLTFKQHVTFKITPPPPSSFYLFIYFSPAKFIFVNELSEGMETWHPFAFQPVSKWSNDKDTRQKIFCDHLQNTSEAQHGHFRGLQIYKMQQIKHRVCFLNLK